MKSQTAQILVLLAGALSAASSQTGPGIFEGSGDVGAPSHKGGVAYDPAKGEYRITGGGANMWGARDDFFFVWKQISGDVAITATVKILSDGNNHRKAGLVFRKDLEPGSVLSSAMVHGLATTDHTWYCVCPKLQMAYPNHSNGKSSLFAEPIGCSTWQ